MQRFQPALAWAANASTEIVTRVGGFAGHATTTTRKYAPLFFALLTPISLLPFLFAAWCLAADLGIASQFPVHGALSRWMMWAAVGIMLQAAMRANRRTAK